MKSLTSLSNILVRTFWPFLRMSFTLQLGPGACRRYTCYFYHGVALGYDFLPPIVLFWIICLKIKYCIFFPLPTSHFAHVSFILCLDITPVRISSITERLSPQLYWLLLSPPSQTVAPTLLAGPTLQWDFSPPTLFPIQFPYWDNRLSFGFFTLDNGTDRSFRNVSKKLPLLAA